MRQYWAKNNKGNIHIGKYLRNGGWFVKVDKYIVTPNIYPQYHLYKIVSYDLEPEFICSYDNIYDAIERGEKIN